MGILSDKRWLILALLCLKIGFLAHGAKATVQGTARNRLPQSSRNPPPSIIKNDPTHGDSSYNFELLHTTERYENDGTERKEVSARIRILNWSGAQQWPELSFQHNPSREHVEIRSVQVVRKDDEIVKVHTADSPIFGPRRSHGPDFDETRVLLPSLAPGDAIHYTVDTTSTIPLARGHFWQAYSFQASITDEELEVSIPDYRKPRLKTKPWVQTSVRELNGQRFFTFRLLTALATTHNQEDNGASSRLSPDILMSTFESWEDVGRWYGQLEKSRRTPSPLVRAKADELTKSLSTDFEKVEALYKFTSTEVVNFSPAAFGLGGYEPRTAEEVLETRYGDCKDKDVLLAALLEAEGWHTSSALISTFREFDRDVPSPWPFTHVVTVLSLRGKQVWMDSSTPLVQFRTLPHVLHKKRALVLSPDATPHFEDTP